MHIKGEHLLQVFEHVIKESFAKTSLLKPLPVSIHGLLMSLEVAVKVSFLVGLIMGVGVGVEVVLVLLVLAKRVRVFENVIKVEVEGVEVLVEVIVAATTASSSSSSIALP